MNIFIHNLLLLNAGIAAVIAAFLLIRHLFKGKVYTRILCAIWLVIFLRMLIPIPIESDLAKNNIVSVPYSSLQISTASRNSSAAANTQGSETNISTVQNEPAGEASVGSAPEGIPQVTNYIKKYDIPLLIYVLGAAIILGYILILNIAFAYKLKTNITKIELSEYDKQIFAHQKMKVRNVYLSEHINSPCLAGVLSPKIVLNSKSHEHEKTRRYSLYHETTHYKHKDNLIYMLGLAACIVNWFNPFMWIALILSKKDREVLCDERVVKLIGEDEVADYGKSLLYLSRKTSLSALAASATMIGGKNEMKQRIKNLANGKKKWIIGSVLMAAIIIALVLIVGTKKPPEPIQEARTYLDITNLFNLENYPEYTALFDKARDPENIMMFYLMKADINKDGNRELYSNSIATGGEYRSSLIECYDLETDTYSAIAEDEKWDYRLITYGDKIYILKTDKQSAPDAEIYSMYRAVLEDGKLAYTEIEDKLAQKILDYVFSSGTISISSNGEHTMTVSAKAITDLSIYDTSADDKLLFSYTQEDEAIIKRFFSLLGQGHNVDQQSTDSPYQAIVKVNDEGTEKILTIDFGNSEYLYIDSGNGAEGRKSDGLLNYLLHLAEG